MAYLPLDPKRKRQVAWSLPIGGIAVAFAVVEPALLGQRAPGFPLPLLLLFGLLLAADVVAISYSYSRPVPPWLLWALVALTSGVVFYEGFVVDQIVGQVDKGDLFNLMKFNIVGPTLCLVFLARQLVPGRWRGRVVSPRQRVKRVVVAVVLAPVLVCAAAGGVWLVLLNPSWQDDGKTTGADRALGISYTIPAGYRRSGVSSGSGRLAIWRVGPSDEHGGGTIEVRRVESSALFAKSPTEAIRKITRRDDYPDDYPNLRFEGERWRTWDGPNLPGALYSATETRYKDDHSVAGTPNRLAYAVVGHPGDYWQVYSNSLGDNPVDEYALYVVGSSIKPL